jgi:flagellar basal-body rod modification protein FlgD
MNEITAVAAGERIDTGRTRLADNYETFMLLLTTQLKNQDPLSPVDSNQFTAQLVQMAGVEQQLLTNDLLKSLLGQNQGGLGSAVEYIGRDVTAAWAATRLENGEAKWSYELGRDAADVKLEVLDGTGKVVWSGPAPATTEGLHDFVWDGRSSSGATLPDGGVYTLRISATGSTGSAVPAQVLVRGRATAVEMYDGQPFLTVGGSILPLANVISVEEPRPAATA